MAKKYYVVWKGRRTGIFDSWEECEVQVKGFPGARFKSFPSRALAEAAFASPPPEGKLESQKVHSPTLRSQAWLLLPSPPQIPSICVDAACDGAPGRMEYQGVWTESGEAIFHQGPFEEATVNIGEFLAIVQGLAWLQRQGLEMPVYTDSVVALRWVKSGKCRSELPENERNRPVFELVRRAEEFLRKNPQAIGWVRKWDTNAWGENPADFNRK